MKKISLLLLMLLLTVSLAPAETITLKTIVPTQTTVRGAQGVIGNGPDGTGSTTNRTWDYKTFVPGSNLLFVGSGIGIGTDTDNHGYPLYICCNGGSSGVSTPPIFDGSSLVLENVDTNGYDSSSIVFHSTTTGGAMYISSAIIGECVQHNPMWGSIQFWTQGPNDTPGTIKMAMQVGHNSNTIGDFNVVTIGDASTPITSTACTINGALQVNGDLNITGHPHDNGNGAWTASDIRLKKNVSTLSGVLDKIAQLRAVSFEWKDSKRRGSDTNIGMIAQEVEKVFPELVDVGPDGYKELSYSKIGPIAVQAIKELQSENDALKKKVDSLEARLDKIEKR